MGSTIAKYLAIIGGICLLIAGITGMAAMESIKNFVVGTLGIHNDNLNLVFAVLIFIAALGGIAVIIGGLLLSGSLAGIGKFLIALGAGIGLFGLLIAIAINYYHGNDSLMVGSGVGFAGVILSIVARILA